MHIYFIYLKRILSIFTNIMCLQITIYYGTMPLKSNNILVKYYLQLFQQFKPYLWDANYKANDIYVQKKKP